MLYLTAAVDSTKKYTGFTLQGHASDSLVCAGVSAIAQTAVAGILHYDPSACYHIDEGMTAVVSRTPDPVSQGILETAIKGVIATARCGHNQLRVRYRSQQDWPFADKT